MEHANIVHRCFRCGYCKFPLDYQDFNCPPYMVFGFDTYSTAGRMWLIYAWLTNQIEASPRFAEILYSCVSCANCKEHCVYVFKDQLLDVFEEAKAALVNSGKIPPAVRDYFKAVNLHGNPYKLPQDQRASWAQGLDIEPYEGQEYLLYVGCVGSFDEVGQRMARSVASVLIEGGVSFGILGQEELCDGNEVKVLGETGLFDSLAHRNINLFQQKGVKSIITLDPHSYNVFKNVYPQKGAKLRVKHFTEVLASLLKDGTISPNGIDSKVTYHDPCYLGRHNGIYDPPRRILKRIPGAELVEMRRTRENALCCGGGGGNFFTDILGSGEESPSRERIREAARTGAQILAVACPTCYKMLSDGLKAEGLDDQMDVMDIASVVKMVT
jgi:Fe-S oxidoreductase